MRANWCWPMLNKTRDLIEQIRMRLLIRRVRKNLEFFGYDVSHLTDQQLLDSIGLAGHHLARASREAGVSMGQMAEAWTNVAAASRRMGEPDNG